MRVVCYVRDGVARLGVLDGEDAIVEAGGFVAWRVPDPCEIRGPRFDLKEVRLLPAVPRPGKILAVGRNYAAHVEEGRRLWAERGRAVVRPPFPSGFVKVASALIAEGDPIRIPPGITTVDHEIELAVVIGRRALDVGVDEALSYVAGYTIANDVAAREIQIPEMEQLGLLVSKNFPTFAPLGPWVVTADEIPDPQDLALTLEVNGEVRQSASTADMLFTVAEVIAAWSRMGLDTGDVILTGTPSGVALSRPDPENFYLRAGDVVRATIERIGTLENPVSA
jgi:5-carboxymethyl-2-hydroxymuconate isomerase